LPVFHYHQPNPPFLSKSLSYKDLLQFPLILSIAILYVFLQQYKQKKSSGKEEFKKKIFGALFARGSPRAKNRAIRSKSSDLLMQILWAFRSYPWRSAARVCECFAFTDAPGIHFA
jgi:hypothetical protein